MNFFEGFFKKKETKESDAAELSKSVEEMEAHSKQVEGEAAYSVDESEIDDLEAALQNPTFSKEGYGEPTQEKKLRMENPEDLQMEAVDGSELSSGEWVSERKETEVSVEPFSKESLSSEDRKEIDQEDRREAA